MVRVCAGQELPKERSEKAYLPRTLGNQAHEVWDVTDPSQPACLTTVIDGLGGTHKNWCEYRTGIAYLVADGRPAGWGTSRMTKIFDLSDPARPRFSGVSTDGSYREYGSTGVKETPMAITLSHGGPTMFCSSAPSPEVLVGTIHGVVHMARDADGP
jgi:hypothetical protein